MEREEIEEALDERDEEIAEAFAVVRGRVQFTWRRLPAVARRAKAAARKPGSGAEYLRRAANPPLPAAFKILRAKLKPLIAGERFQPATAKLPDSLYHLVERKHSGRYTTAARAMQKATPPLALSGPFPPFAFAPDLL